jgi:hypothetical protein
MYKTCAKNILEGFEFFFYSIFYKVEASKKLNDEGIFLRGGVQNLSFKIAK